MTTDPKCSYWFRLRVLYALAWHCKFYKRGAPIHDAITKLFGLAVLVVGTVVLSPFIVLLLVLSWLWMPFYPAWRAIRAKSHGIYAVERYLKSIRERAKEKAGAAH